MRISDWSSDVCSSDLRFHAVLLGQPRRRQPDPRDEAELSGDAQPSARLFAGGSPDRHLAQAAHAIRGAAAPGGSPSGVAAIRARTLIDCLAARSEEHTSELQSLMRTSYAVFCFN